MAHEAAAGEYGGIGAFLDMALLAGGVGVWNWPVGDDRMILSPYLETLLGYPSSGFDSAKATFLARLLPLDRERFERSIGHAIERDAEFECEFRLHDMAGALRWFAAKGRLLRNLSGTPIRIVGTMQEIPATVVTERRMRREQDALLGLVTDKRNEAASLDAVFARITEAAGRTLDVERTSVWLVSRDRDKLHCKSMFRRSLGQQMACVDLDVTRYPGYFRALEQNRAIDASDARNDPRTRELAADYLVPLGIASMLDSTIRSDDGALAGVVCHEHVGPVREWTLDEKAFAASIADMVARVLSDDQRRQLSAALAQSEARYRTFVAISTEAVLGAEFMPPVKTDLPLLEQADAITARAVIIEHNAALSRMLGMSPTDDLRGRRITDLLPEGLARSIAIEWIGAGYRLSEQEFSLTTFDGLVRWILGSNVGVIQHGELTGLWSTWRDITSRKRALVDLEFQARHDPLTGLPNRKSLAERLGVCIDDARANSRGLALLLMDLDRFKEINDGLGHQAGDDLLKQIGPRLSPILDAVHGEIARLGGDEFAVILCLPGDQSAIHAIATSLADALRRPFRVGSLQLSIDVSIGISLYPLHGSDGSMLLRCADVAMYDAKRKRVRTQLYSTELDRHSPRRLALATALGEAIRFGAIRLHYQPIVSLRERRLEGVEALARWQNVEFGTIPPEEFIPIAEMGDQIRELTLHVLLQAAGQWVAWRRAGLATVVSVNISSRVLLDENFVGEVQRILNGHNLPGRNMQFEITESVMLADPTRAIEAVSKLNALGICFSMDDFGIGFSSLATLKQLPLTNLKIDRSFVSQMPRSERDTSIVRSTIHLAHDLGLGVIAEGVDSPDSLKMVTQMGCDQAQGFVIARPAEGRMITEWARNYP